MRIYNRKEFLKLGVCLFCKGCKWSFESLCLKQDTIFDTEGRGIDFFYIDLCDIDSESSQDHAYLLDWMDSENGSVGINTSESRDGMFDENDVFLVYEPKDISWLFAIFDVLCNYSMLSKEYFDVKVNQRLNGK